MIAVKDFDAKLLRDINDFRNAEVMAALQQHANLHLAADSYGSTLLHHATVDGNNDIVKHLLAAGAKVDAQDRHGTTPLMLILKRERRWTMGLLLDAGANIHLADSSGHSVLRQVLHNDEVGTEEVRLFFEVVKRQCKSVDEIVEVLSRVDCPLYHAVLWGNERITSSRLEAGLSVDSCDEIGGRTALHVAVRFGDLANVRLLLERGANANEGDSGERTALSYFNARSDSAENLEILRLLVARGASFYSCDWNGRMQMYYVLKYGVRNVVRALLQNNSIKLSRQDDNGHTALHYLAENENGVIDELRGRKFKVDVSDDVGCTPLHLAACAGCLDNVTFLLDNGADINRPNKTYMTPLFYAVVTSTSRSREMGAKRECIEALLQRGADAQYEGNGVHTVFDIVGSFSNYPLSKPILLHLAIREMLGTPIARKIREQIDSEAYFARHLNLYRRQLRVMQKSRVHESVTLFEFVAGSDRKIARYARNRHIVKRLMRLRTKSTSATHCKRYLRKRIVKAMRMAQSKQQAAVAVGNVVNLGAGRCYTDVVDRIAEYLSELDVRNLFKAREM